MTTSESGGMADTTDSKSVAFGREGSSPSSRTMRDRLWPIAILQDRYNGVYSGGKWVAIPNADMAEDFEETVWGDDFECVDWIARCRDIIGVADTPDEALYELYLKHAAYDSE